MLHSLVHLGLNSVLYIVHFVHFQTSQIDAIISFFGFVPSHECKLYSPLSCAVCGSNFEETLPAKCLPVLDAARLVANMI